MAKKRGTSVLATLLFTDIIGSTALAEEMGDRRWRELLSRHHAIQRKALREFGGTELDTAGDGVFARFDSPASAIRCACAVAEAVEALGIEIRAGIHIGECEVFDGKLSGVNVHAAARTMAVAGANQVVVTSGVRDVVRGAGFDFADRGAHALKGIEGEWHLFEVVGVDGTPRPGPLDEQDASARRGAIEPPPLAQRRKVRLAAAVAAAAVLVAGASVGLPRAFGHSAKAPLTGCEVTSIGSINDRAFNQAVFDGLTDAASTWGIDVRDRVSQALGPDATEAEWGRLIGDFAKGKRCGLIVTVGSAMAPTTIAAARKSPAERFLVTDANAGGLSNVSSVVFKADQGAFLAGYLAAATSRTGKVATFGGIPIPQVLGYMNGFAAGVLYYNRTSGKNVQLLGWNPTTRKGLFVDPDPRDFGAFGDAATARELTRELISDGADIVFPVDGPNGDIGAGGAAQRAHGVLLIGIDNDQHFETPQYEALWLTSVLKVYRKMVYVVMGQVVDGSFKGGTVTGTLANGGVALAPYYGLGSRVPRRLRDSLKRIERGITNRSIPLDPAAYTGT